MSPGAVHQRLSDIERLQRAHPNLLGVKTDELYDHINSKNAAEYRWALTDGLYATHQLLLELERGQNT